MSAADTVDLVATVFARLTALARVALVAARAGDSKAVDDILPDPASYPDGHAYQRLRAQADEDYGPSADE